MKRPMWVIGVTISVSIWASSYLEARMLLPISVCFALTGILFALIPKEKLRVVAVVLLSTGLALGISLLENYRRLAPFDGMDNLGLIVEGLVENVENARNSVRYTILANFPENPALPKTRITLTQYGDADFTAGDTVRCEAVLSSPEILELGSYYRARSISAIGYMGRAESVELNGYETQTYLLRLRSMLTRNLYSNLPADSAALAAGILMGQTGSVSSDDYNAMQRSGTSHILSVSGLHLSIFSACILRLLESFKLNRRLRAILVIAISLVFSAAVGFGPSVTRAFVMLAVAMTGQIISRQSDALNSLGFSLLLISVFAPGWMLGASLWLSATATAGIIIMGIPLADRLNSRLNHDRTMRPLVRVIADSLGITSGAYLFTMPIILFMNGWLPLLSPLANLAVSPFMTVIMLGGILTALLPSTVPFIGAVAFAVRLCIGMVMEVSRFFAGFSFSILRFDHLWKLIFLVCVAVVVFILIRKKSSAFAFVAGFLLSVSFFQLVGTSADYLSRNTVELVVIGREQTPLLIRGQSAVPLRIPDNYSATELSNYLIFRGIKQIDLLVAHEFDGHIHSGLLALGKTAPIRAAIGPADLHGRNQLARALPGVEIYPPAGAEIELLGGVDIYLSHDSGETVIKAGRQFILQTGSGYDIINMYGENAILLGEGELILPVGVSPSVEPVGQQVFTEKRIILNTD